MKALVFVAVCLGLTVTAMAEQPVVPIRKALEIAEKSLADRGLQKEMWVEAITLDKSSLTGGKPFWFVRWNKTIPASDPKNREIGVKVYMDGKAVRLVREPHP